jgi:NmrA-like family
MQARRTIAVAGATGRVGRHVVDVLTTGGHDVVAMSRSSGVDVVTGEGLAEALAGVECVIDVATGPSPAQEAATTYFTTAARNLHAADPALSPSPIAGLGQAGGKVGEASRAGLPRAMHGRVMGGHAVRRGADPGGGQLPCLEQRQVQAASPAHELRQRGIWPCEQHHRSTLSPL